MSEHRCFNVSLGMVQFVITYLLVYYSCKWIPRLSKVDVVTVDLTRYLPCLD